MHYQFMSSLYRYIRLSLCLLLSTSATSTLTLLGQEDSLDVGQDSTLGNSHPRHQLVELFIVPDGQLQMSGNDAGLLVVPGSVTSQLKDLSCQVFHDGCHVHRCTCTHPLGIVPLPEEPVDSPHWELQSSPA